MTAAADTARLDRRLSLLAARGEVCLANPPRPTRPSPTRRRAGLPDRVAAKAINHLAQGERLTAQLCSRLSKALPLASARACIAVQGAEERIHASLYESYAAALGGRMPDSPAVDLMAREAAAWDGPPEALILAIHVLLESEALALQQSAANWFPCPGLQTMNDRISRDEGRHLSFGRQYLSAALPTLSAAERARIFVWLQEAWLRVTRTVVSDLGPSWSPMVLGFTAWRRRRWTAALSEFEAVGLIRPHRTKGASA